MNADFHGVYAALLTPWDTNGCVDFAAHDQIVDFLLGAGVDGIVVGGGTGEYPHLDLTVRQDLINRTIRRVDGKVKILASIGTSSIHGTLKLGRCAIDAGSDAILLPMPHFFRYEQDDLKAFCERTCSILKAPCLLYNLPAFTNPLQVETAVELLDAEPHILGMKDSSGDRSSLQRLADARKERNFSLFVGDDGVVFDALAAGWDGVISGIACFVPELVRKLFQDFKAGDLHKARWAQDDLQKLIREILRLPVPWGVRVGLSTRGLPAGEFALPLSERRKRQVAALRSWILTWFDEVSEQLEWERPVRVG